MKIDMSEITEIKECSQITVNEHLGKGWILIEVFGFSFHETLGPANQMVSNYKIIYVLGRKKQEASYADTPGV